MSTMSEKKGANVMDGEVSAIVQGIREQMVGIQRRLEKLESFTSSVQELALSVREIAVKQNTMEEKVDRIDSAVNEINSKPAKRWDLIVTALLTGLVGALITGYFVIPK